MAKFSKHISVVALAFLVLPACASKKFKGEAASKDAKPGRVQPGSSKGEVEEPVITPPTTTNPVVENPTPVEGDPGVIENKGNSIPGTPVVPVVNEPGKTIPEKGTPPTAEMGVEFGTNAVFRIGDNFAYQTSNCAGQVNSHPLTGTVFNFEFEVLSDDTAIDLVIGTLCGVDKANLSHISLQKGGELVLPKIALPVDGNRSGAYEPYARFVLKKGVHRIVVKSTSTDGTLLPDNPPAGYDKFDDFIIGKIQVKANKQVKAGAITSARN